MSALRPLLSALFDYAGLFPPAGLTLRQAVERFAVHRRSAAAWMLGRFVLPASQLAAFADLYAALPEEDRAGCWVLSVLLGADLESDLRALGFLGGAHGLSGPLVAAFETPAIASEGAGGAEGVERIERLKALCPAATELYFELPLAAPPQELARLVSAVGAVGGAAKVRTGGVRAEDFAPPEALLDFLVACARERVPFKATAGLHHPVRRNAPLSPPAEGPCALMFGYLNLTLAAASLWVGGEAGAPLRALRVLERRDSEDLRFEEGAVAWGGERWEAADLEVARRDFCRSIGSCSFTEPVEEIRALGFAAETGVEAVAAELAGVTA